MEMDPEWHERMHSYAIRRECDYAEHITAQIQEPVMPEDIDVKTVDYLLRCVQGEYYCPFCVDYGYECDGGCTHPIEEMIGSIMTAAKVAHGYPESDIKLDYK